MLINYEALTKKYQEDIQVKLRGFRPAHEFLEMWVHDEGDAKSILNIVESAELGGVKSLEIQIGNNTLKKMNVDRLVSLISSYGTPAIDQNADGVILKVHYEQ